jgi:hypothetical protein
VLCDEAPEVAVHFSFLNPFPNPSSDVFHPKEFTMKLIQTRRAAEKKQAGFFSLELSLTLLVAAIAIVAAVLLYLENVRKNSINSNVQYVQLIAGNAKTTYGVRNQYAQLTTAVAVQGRLIPEMLRNAALNTASNPFGAAITVASTNGTGTADVLDLAWDNVPADQCAGIVSGTEGSMRSVVVGGVTVKALDGAINIAGMTAACDAAANVDINFRIGRS